MIPTLKTHRRNAPESKPVPSVVLPQPYKIMQPPDAQSGMCSKGGMYGTPLDSSPQSLAIRAHEYGHLSIDRLQPQLDDLRTKAPSDWYQVGLDNIVNGYCDAVGVDVSRLPQGKCPKDTPRLTRAIHALQTLSFKKRKSFPGLTAKDVEVLQTASKRLRKLGEYCKNPKSYSVTSKYIASILNRLADYFGSEPIRDDRSDLKILVAYGEGNEDGTYGKKPAWARCTIETRGLDKSINRKYTQRKRIAGFFGAFRNPLRTLIPAFDGQGWAMKQKRQGGTILLDQSGSMSISEDDLKRLLQDAPHATIAAYSSHADEGTVRIYAQKGKYASDCDSNGMGANGIDGPALDWLAKQTMPRVWICDGGVTGVDDEPHPDLSMECARKCQEHGILRVDSIGRYFDLAGIKS